MAEKKEITLPVGLKRQKTGALLCQLAMPFTIIPQAALPPGAENINLEAAVDDAETRSEQNKYIEASFTQIPFRAISARYLGPSGYWLDFSKDGGKALKESIVKMLPMELDGERRTWLKFHANHAERIEARIGYVAAAVWGKEDKQFSAPGINITVMIHNELGARELVQLQSDPPLLDSVSMSILFNWEPSHPDLKEWEFWSMLGHEVDGDIVRLVVTEILDYFHVALVTEGADEEADRILNGNQNLQINMEVQDMDKLTFELPQVKALAGLLGVAEINTFQDLEHGITKMIADGAVNKTLAEKYQAALEKRRSDLKQTIAKVDAESALINLVDKMDWESVDLLEKEYFFKLEAKFPARCVECGSKNIERRSSLEVNPVAGEQEPKGEKIDASAYKTGKK